MKKTLKFAAILFFLMILSGCAKKEISCPVCLEQPKISEQEQVMRAIAYYRSTTNTRDWDFHFIQGYSMVEYGFKDGNYVIAKRGDCQVGDFCIFQCLSVKCDNTTGEEIIKKVIKQDGDKFWFQGNEHRGTCPAGVISDTNCNSFDSRDYGWLIKNVDFKFAGPTTLESQFNPADFE
jgi:hypothetical protein